MSPLVRRWNPGRPVPVGAILGQLRRGSGDPTWAQDDAGIWRAAHTPAGPVSLHLVADPSDGVLARAWGPGAEWVLDGLPGLLGDDDDTTGFELHHDVLRQVHRTHQHWRVTRTRLVVDALVPAVIEQRVTGKQAFGGYRMLVRRFGSPAPGEGAGRVMLPPTVAQWRRIPSWEWLRAGVDAARSATVMRALRVAPQLERAIDLPIAQAHSRLRSVAGIGRWTAAEVAQRAFGDADAVSFGDYHVAKDIGWALRGREVDDDELEVVLRPYAGHRFRVQYLVAAGRLGRPRRGARLSVPTHLPVRRGF